MKYRTIGTAPATRRDESLAAVGRELAGEQRAPLDAAR